RIAKCSWLYGDEMKPLLPYLDGYTTINKLAGFKPAQFEELIESWREQPHRITRKELKEIEGKTKPQPRVGFTPFLEFGSQSDLAEHFTPEQKVEITKACESLKAQAELLTTAAKCRSTKAFFTA